MPQAPQDPGGEIFRRAYSAGGCQMPEQRSARDVINGSPLGSRSWVLLLVDGRVVFDMWGNFSHFEFRVETLAWIFRYKLIYLALQNLAGWVNLPTSQIPKV